MAVKEEEVVAAVEEAAEVVMEEVVVVAMEAAVEVMTAVVEVHPHPVTVIGLVRAVESITLPETEQNASSAKQLGLLLHCSLLVVVVTEAVTEATAAEEIMATINTHEAVMDTLVVVATAAAIAEAAMVVAAQTDETETNMVVTLVEVVIMTVEAVIVEKEEIDPIRLATM